MTQVKGLNRDMNKDNKDMTNSTPRERAEAAYMVLSQVRE